MVLSRLKVIRGKSIRNSVSFPKMFVWNWHEHWRGSKQGTFFSKCHYFSIGWFSFISSVQIAGIKWDFMSGFVCQQRYSTAQLHVYELDNVSIFHGIEIHFDAERVMPISKSTATFRNWSGERRIFFFFFEADSCHHRYMKIDKY